ncbi:MAG: 3-oxoacyl-[acyl-carrier protein] reductase [Candidatus Paceibacteria bacterium]|jgi:3-oxoacyl-[acyl-carrier protein] reductase
MKNGCENLILEGKHALVCGASKGIGRATAKLLAARGAEVTLLARSVDALQTLKAEIEADGGKARALIMDLEDRSTLIEGLEKLSSDAPAVNILINNTGGPPGGPLLAAEVGAMETALGRHLFASHTLVQALLPGMKSEGYGRIINVLSTSVREPIPNLGVSNLTRAAVASWAKTLSSELPPGVTINNVLPGFTDTERLGSLGEATATRLGKSPEEVRQGWIAQIPEGRLAQPEETAEAIAFLASPAGAYIRGHSIPVDGGRLRSI